MKKIINKPEHVVSELLKGMELSHPELVYTEKLEVIARREKSDKVAVISGGGAGHEGKGERARPRSPWRSGKRRMGWCTGLASASGPSPNGGPRQAPAPRVLHQVAPASAPPSLSSYSIRSGDGARPAADSEIAYEGLREWRHAG